MTPVGRMITRCTQDINTVDGPLSDFFRAFIYITLHLLVNFWAAVVVAGWSALLSGLIVAGIGGFLGRVYLKANLCIRREMSNAKAPVMSLVSATLTGLRKYICVPSNRLLTIAYPASIRAYGAQGLFRDRLTKRVDVYIRCSFTFYDINRWISVRADSLGGIFAGAVSAYLVYGRSVTAGTAGFALSMVLTFSRYILYWVRIYNLLEINGMCRLNCEFA